MRTAVLSLAFIAAAFAARGAEVVRVYGSSTVAQALQAVAPVVKDKLGAELRFDTQVGSGAAIQAIGQGAAELALLTRSITQEERSAFPSKKFSDLEIGTQVLVPFVSRETWDAGIKSITKEQFVALYEGDTKNWKELGHADMPIKFYKPLQGRGVWELFAGWLYGDVRKAPLGNRWETMVTHEEARDSVEFNLGSISVAPPQFIDGKRTMALTIRSSDGSDVAATPEAFASGKWPMLRPLHIVASDRPTGTLRKIMELMTTPEGREAMTKVGFMPAADGSAKLAELLSR